MASGRDGLLNVARRSEVEDRRSFLRLWIAVAALLAAVRLPWSRARPRGEGHEERGRGWREARHWRRI